MSYQKTSKAILDARLELSNGNQPITPGERKRTARGSASSKASSQRVANPYASALAARLNEQRQRMALIYPSLVNGLDDVGADLAPPDISQSSDMITDDNASKEIPDSESQAVVESDSWGEGVQVHTVTIQQSRGRRERCTTQPTSRSVRLYMSWQETLPLLITPMVEVLVMQEEGRVPSIITNPSLSCLVHPNTRQVLCYDAVEVATCQCIHPAERLVRAGFFPSTATEPSVSFSFSLIGFLQRLYEEASDSTTAMASALSRFLDDMGYPFLNAQGLPIDDPIRRSLSSAMQWYDLLWLEVNKQVQEAIDDTMLRVLSKNKEREDGLGQPESEKQSREGKHQVLTYGECPRFLQDRCPLCFAGRYFGKSPSMEGSDIQVSVDANFSNRHARSSGESPEFYDPTYFISKSKVDTVGDRIASARKAPIRPTYVPKVDDASVDSCERSFQAANEAAAKTKGAKFDDTGLTALVCRHDIPLFICNVDTPGEQQKYCIALVEELFKNLPPCATVTVLYDIACVVERSINRYRFLDDNIVKRTAWATSAMHAYGHEWTCQLNYNPRLMDGQGLTDGEGVERLWARLRKLIPISRTSGRTRRIYIIDRRAAHIAAVKHEGLGEWMRRRQTISIDRYTQESRGLILESCLQPTELRREWASQRKAQQSARSHAPARLKQQLQSVLKLQEIIELLEVQIAETKASVKSSGGSTSALGYLKDLLERQNSLTETAENLYTSLNVHDTFPNLQGVSFQFIHTLLMARDLKMIIRQRLIGRFFEMSRIDQSIAGADATLGTKLHQQSCQNLNKRSASTLTAIKKFNGYCATLSKTANPNWNIALPRPLSTVLDSLKDDPYLYEDVWVDSLPNGPPRWMCDEQVRKGIRGILKLDRCQEERVRLFQEGENMIRWYGEALTAVSAALACAMLNGGKFTILLQRRRARLLSLRFRWSNPFVQASRWDHCVDSAARMYDIILHGSNIHPQFLPPKTASSFKIVENEAIDGRGSGGDDLIGRMKPQAKMSGGVIVTIINEAEQQLDEDADEDVEDSIQDELADDFASFRFSEDPQEDEPPQLDTMSWLAIHLEMPDHIMLRHQDFELETAMSDWTRTSSWPSALYGACLDGFGVVDIDPMSLQRLVDPKARLNDIVINGFLSIIAKNYQASEMVVFDTYTLRAHQDGSPPDLMRRRTQHCFKQIGLHGLASDCGQWVIPIHRRTQQHWTIAVLDFYCKRILQFDSFADIRSYESDLTDVISLANSLFIAYNLKIDLSQYWKGWDAFPVLKYAKQTNGYDCGLWILAQYLSLRQGYDVTCLTEREMPDFRHFLMKLGTETFNY
ncbi:hypothetical protein FRC02_010683 [Tulasnella sp. 418]|nr:hypothetical protein FRC02_010683 [Tulasnella sp. 418]